MILVIGGRSKIGSALIDELLSRGEAVRALARPSESGAGFATGVEVVTGDLADADSLRAAMDGADSVFLLCGPTKDEVELNRNAIDSAHDAGVRFVARSSILGADPGSDSTFIRDHGKCDRYLGESGIAHAIVRPNMFAQNITESTIPSIDPDGRFYANAGNARISMVDTRDVAAVAAAILTDPRPGIHEVTGPEALSYADVAEKISSAFGRTIEYVDVPDKGARQAMLGFGMNEWLVNALIELFVDYRRSGVDGYVAAVTDTVERLTGTPARTLDALIAESGAAVAPA